MHSLVKLIKHRIVDIYDQSSRDSPRFSEYYIFN